METNHLKKWINEISQSKLNNLGCTITSDSQLYNHYVKNCQKKNIEPFSRLTCDKALEEANFNPRPYFINKF